MNIKLKTIPHKKQRYPTLGDWKTKDKKLSEILVSEFKNPHYEFLIAVHELLEAYLCLQRGITMKMVDEFDLKYEKNRRPGDISEPGDDRHAPYFEEHQFAQRIEHLLAKELGVNWIEYLESEPKVVDKSRKVNRNMGRRAY